MGTLSNWGAGANILKSLIGLGILTLPYATRQVGWLASVVGFAVVAVMSVQGIFFAAMAREAQEKSAAESTSDGDGDLPELSKTQHTMGFFDNVVRSILGWPGQVLYSSSVAFAQITTVVSYIDTIAISSEIYMPTHRLLTLVIIGAILVLLSTVRTLTGVSYLAYMGLLTYFVVFIALIIEAAHSGAVGTLGHGTTAFRGGDSDYGTWFGLSAFAFGGFAIGIVVYDDMKEPRHFYKVVAVAYGVCWLFYSMFAVLGYLCYGDSTNEVIYFNFPHKNGLRDLSLVVICIVLLLTYVVQLMPVYGWAESVSKGVLHYTVARGLLVVTTVCLAGFVRNLVLLISVGGALTSAISSFILPPITYVLISPRVLWTEYVAAFCLISLGICGAVQALL